jgi:phage protein D
MAAITPIPIFSTGETFYVPQVQVYVSGTLLADSIVEDILQVTYQDEVNKMDSFSIEINNWDATYQTFKFAPPLRNPIVDYSGIFDPGNKIEIWMGYQDNMRRMMRGSITTISPQFSQSAPPTLTISGLNELQDYRTQQHTYSWNDGTKTDTQIAQQMCGWSQQPGQPGLGLPIITNPMPNEQPDPIVYMKTQFDIMFLLERAKRRGYEVYIRNQPTGPALYFGLSGNTANVPVYQLEWGKSIISFTPTLATGKQVSQVSVRGWDRKANSAINETCTLQQLWQSQGKSQAEIARLTQIAQAYSNRSEVVTDQPMHTTAEAQSYAQSVLDKRSKELITAQVTTLGLPDLRAGSSVEIIGFGVTTSQTGQLQGASSDFDGEYYVTASTHTIGDGGYQTEFSARREGPVTGLPVGTAST